MTTRKIDENGDWTFGNGKGNYIIENEEVIQNLKTRLRSFLGDCFFSLESGIDWFNLCGGKDLVKLRLSLSTTILNTDNITRLNEIDVQLSEDRKATIRYNVNTTYGEISDEINLEL